jgi:hypothetical protein
MNTPPKMTDEQIEAIFQSVERFDFADVVVPFARAIEAARDQQWAKHVEGLERDAARLSEKAQIHDAINRACKELPIGFDLHIELEKDAGTVRLYLPDTDAEQDDFGSDLTFAETINAAIDAAIAQQTKEKP